MRTIWFLDQPQTDEGRGGIEGESTETKTTTEQPPPSGTASVRDDQYETEMPVLS